jgi:hypothetical protein
VKAKKPIESETFGYTSKLKKKKAGPSPSDVCWHCNASRPFLRNCKKYLEEKKNRAALGINIIEINLTTRSNDACVLDIGAMINTCKSLQMLKRVRPIARNEVDLHVSVGIKKPRATRS